MRWGYLRKSLIRGQILTTSFSSMQGEPIDVIPSPEIQYFHDGEPEAHPHVESNTSYFGAIQWNVESWGSDAMNGLGVQQSKRRGHKKCFKDVLKF